MTVALIFPSEKSHRTECFFNVFNKYKGQSEIVDTPFGVLDTGQHSAYFKMKREDWTGR